tara:strand:- start:20143 stop:20385 length:243 start_codon:yes stop_codon:yes gene_type:complete
MKTYFKHPECLNGEVFLSNMSLENYQNLEFQTKRKGNIPYDGIGDELSYENWYPIFIEQQELDSLNRSLQEVRDLIVKQQ